MIATPETWRWPSFRPEELVCQHTGRHGMQAEFMDWLQGLRDAYGHPMIITSGFRDPSHPIEARKAAPGTHSLGCAVDVGCRGVYAFLLIERAIQAGVRGLGVAQKGNARFIHLDMAPAAEGRPRPHVWSY